MVQNGLIRPSLNDLEQLIASPFARTRSLLNGIEPSLPPIDLTIGEPRHGLPDMLSGALQEKFAGYGRYPPIHGTPELLSAICAWIERRYPALYGQIDSERHILPLSGSREGLFTAIFPAIARRTELARPVVLMPNPFYQAYLAAAIAGGAEPIFLAAEEANGFLPDLNSISEEILSRTVVFYLASPANPQGTVAGTAYLEQAISLARHYDFLLLLDECYSEIWFEAPPPGGLETAHRANGEFSNILVFNSLSKRSNAPGLRSGFIAGDEQFLGSFSRFRNVAAPQMPLPVQHASALLWSEEAHVKQSRALYVAKFAAANDILRSTLSFTNPGGAFFLWPKTDHLGGGEEATKTFWKECGVKVLPGAYLAQRDSTGYNPGADYIRIALVDDLARTRQALERLASYLS